MSDYILVRDPEPKILVRRPGKMRPKPLRLEPSYRVWGHSPTGFEWGYGGSGPAQAALAILLDHMKDKRKALEHHQVFKWVFVAKLPERGGEIHGNQIDQWLASGAHMDYSQAR